jgi:hypothetical protein
VLRFATVLVPDVLRAAVDFAVCVGAMCNLYR